MQHSIYMCHVSILNIFKSLWAFV